MELTAIFKTEESSKRTVVLYRFGAFWHAYQRSAYFIIRDIKKYPIRHKQLKELKVLKAELVYVRIPETELATFLIQAEACGFVVKERTEEQIVLDGFKGGCGYDAWRNLAAHSHRPLTDFESLKETLFELETASVVVKGTSVCFNRVRKLDTYRRLLGEKFMQIVVDSLKWEECYSPVLLHKRLSVLLHCTKSCYRVRVDERIEHKKLSIVCEGQQVGLEELPESVRQRIREFIAAQYETACKLSDMLNEKTLQPSNFPFEWAGMQIELLELIWLLYRTKSIVPREPDASLQLSVELFFRLLHQEPPKQIHQQIYKLMNRQKSKKFIQKLSIEADRIRSVQES